jgi:4-amino-4-deoxy-L-arabinose transferase-like glycosyltransferase
MLERDYWQGWMVPRIQNEPRLNKPPLIYWAQAGSACLFTGRTFGTPPRVAALNDAIWMYRLPSLLAAIAAVMFTWRLGCSMFDSRAGFLGAMLLASSPIMIWESHQARADMLLVACTTGAIWALWEGFKQARTSGTVRPTTWIALWLAIGMGAMTKGPITAMVVMLTMLGVCFFMRSMRWTWALKPLVGTVIVEGCVVPWLLIVIDMVGGHNYWRIIKRELIDRAGTAAEGHGGPPGYHMLLMVVLLGAGSMLIWPGLARAWRVAFSRDTSKKWFGRFWSMRLRRPAEAFLLCWIVLPWIVFEISSTKLPHYTMPMYPALALVAARAVLAADAGRHPFKHPRLISVLTLMWSIALSAAVFAFGLLAAYATWRAWGSAASMVVAALWTTATGLLAMKAFQFRRGGQWLYLQRTGIAMSVAVALALGLAGSTLPEIRVSRTLAQRINAIDPARSRDIVAVEYGESEPRKRDWGGFVEDSLIFETHGKATRLNGEKFPAWIQEHPGGLVCIEEQALRRYAGLDMLAAFSPDVSSVKQLKILDMVPGFNYSKGKFVKVYLAEVAP